MMSEYNYGIVKIGDYLFCHAGLQYNICEKYEFDIPFMNKILIAFLRDELEDFPNLLEAFNDIYGSEGITWSRALAHDDFEQCTKLPEILNKMDVKTLFVGHTKHDEISGKCHDLMYVLDSGLSANISHCQYAKITTDGIIFESTPVSEALLCPRKKM